jgi:hypothetical protein
VVWGVAQPASSRMQAVSAQQIKKVLRFMVVSSRCGLLNFDLLVLNFV